MYYQIANTAPLHLIIYQLDLPFIFKELCSERKEINGLNQATIEIITGENLGKYP
ncbi:hypothetical protein MWU59_12325 [Flavobacteriaceae bacterium F08102]|nr:hypothetical protein [Flavobacteriaceae bacterium F08102]